MSLRERILKEAFQLFAKNGVKKTSIKAIAEASETSNGGLYHHFANKNEIALEVLMQIKLEVLEVTNSIKNVKSTKEFIFSLWKSKVNMGINEPEKFMFVKYMNSAVDCKSYIDKRKTPEMDKFLSILKGMIEKGDVLDQDLEYFELYFSGAVDAVVTYLTKNKDKISDEFIEEKFRYFWRSVVNI